MDDLGEQAPTDPLFHQLCCHLALDIPDEIAVQALKQARAEIPNGHAASIVSHAAYLIRRKGWTWI